MTRAFSQIAVSLLSPGSMIQSFGELQVEYSLNGNILLATQPLSFTVSRIPPEKYLEFRDFVNASLREERQRLRVQKIGS